MQLSHQSHPQATRALAANRPALRVGERARIMLVLLIALAHGLAYLFLMPPWQHYEEPSHFEYAWLIANRGYVPRAGEIDDALRREIAASMVEHRFYQGLPAPDLAAEPTPSIGSPEYPLQPPAYYALVSLPLRLVDRLDIAAQLYVARFVSLALFLLTILVVAGAARDLAPPRHTLRWLAPLSAALLPPFVDLMTAVNNDVGATLAMSLFLWGAVRAIRFGLSWRRLLWIAGAAALCVAVKGTAAIAVALAPLALLAAFWRGRGWRWHMLLLPVAALVAAGVVVCFELSAAAYWSPWPTGAAQAALPRVASAQAPHGDRAIVAQAGPGAPAGPLLSAIHLPDVRQLAGRTVTIGGWIWADRAATIKAPGLVWNPRGTTGLLAMFGENVQVATTPRFVARSFVVPEQVGVLHYALFNNLVEPKGAPLRIFLDGAVLVEGDFPSNTPPSFVDATARSGTWAGRPFANLVRNASGEELWPRPRPWLDRAIVERLGFAPAWLVATSSDMERVAPFLWDGLARSLPKTFFATFAWAQIGLPGEWLAYIFQALALLVLAGYLRWWLRARPATGVRPAVAFLALAGLLSCCGALVWPLMHFWGTEVPAPAARYVFPAILPAMLGLSGGWLALWPRRLRAEAGVLLVIAILALDIMAMHTIAGFYRALPPS